MWFLHSSIKPDSLSPELRETHLFTVQYEDKAVSHILLCCKSTEKVRQSIMWHVLAKLTGMDFNHLRIEDQNRTLLDYSYLFDKYKRGATLESISKLEFQGKDNICFTQYDISVGPRQANLVLIAYASSEGSGEPAHPRSLARTSAARSYKQWVKRNLQTESQIPGPSEWLGMRS